MTAGKWAVRRTESELWSVWEGDSYHRGSYSTWEAAMRFAHRGARTITVTLPADPDRHAPYRGAVASSDAPTKYQFGGPGWEWSNTIGLTATQIEPFALALLAHARRLT